ncbi:MAG: hypothetical protein ACJAZ1_002071 [Yoonia sp.]|jgi:hypothetical protein
MGTGHNGGGPTPKLNPDAVIAALDAVGGIKTAAAEMLGVARSTLYLFIAANPDVEKTIAEIEEKIVDLAEGKMLTSLKAGDGQMIRWFLERKGRSRGYSTRNEITGPDGGAVVVESPTFDVSNLSLEALKEVRAAMLTPDPVDDAE